MKLADIISEARKNPDNNPKTPINHIIVDALNDTTDDISEDLPNLFVSFTSVDKLGINPASKYHTPLGIYAYPAKYVVQAVGIHNQMHNLPFAGESPYVSIFKATGNIVDLWSMTTMESRTHMKAVAAAWAKETDGDIPWKQAVDQVEHIINGTDNANVADYPGGRLWYVVMTATKTLFGPRWKLSTHIAWNKLFRLIGIDGCIDQGAGIIHTSEPTQAVFFSISAITAVQRHHNKYSPSYTQMRRAQGTALAQVHKDYTAKFTSMTPGEIVEYFKYHSPTNMKYVKNKDARMMILQKQPSYVQFFTNPTDKELLVAVTANMNNIRYFPDRITDDILIAGLRADPDAGHIVLKYVPNPSKRVQVALVQAYPSSIFDLTNPPEEAFKMALASGGPSANLVKQYAAKKGFQL